MQELLSNLALQDWATAAAAFVCLWSSVAESHVCYHFYIQCAIVHFIWPLDCHVCSESVRLAWRTPRTLLVKLSGSWQRELCLSCLVLLYTPSYMLQFIQNETDLPDTHFLSFPWWEAHLFKWEVDRVFYLPFHTAFTLCWSHIVFLHTSASTVCGNLAYDILSCAREQCTRMNWEVFVFHCVQHA